MEKYTCIALSTAHIQESDREILFDLVASTTRVMSRTYGYFIKLSGDQQADMEMGMHEGIALSDSLKRLISYAYKVDNCRMIELDCDAGTVDDLPAYEW